MTAIGQNVFTQCGKLESIYVEPLNTNYASVDGILYNKDISTLITCPGAKTAVSIPETVTTIGNFAFSYCTKLESISIPNSVTTLGDYAFSDCNALTQIEMKSKTPLNYRQGFNNTVYTNATLYVPAGSRSVYESTAPWSNFSNIVERVFTGINEIEAASNAKPEITVNNGTIYVNGLADNAPVTILDINGRVVYSGTEHRLNNLVPGLYIIKAGNHTAKAVL